jgi:acyl-coenzyme A synthetase/AMP-(fatty) acid ligase
MVSIYRNSEPPLCPSEFNLAAYVMSAGKQTPGKVALSVLGADSTQDWTYDALRSAIGGVAAGFHAMGLRPGNKVLMRLGNTVEFPLVFLGAAWAGLVPIPVSSTLTVTEISRIAELVRPHVIVAADGVSLPVSTQLPILTTDDIEAMRMLPPMSPDIGDPNRPGYIVFTSGTSGTPRGIMHAHRAVWARRMMWDGWYGLRSDDRLLHAGAFNWTYTLGTGLMDPWAIGATALIPEQGLPTAIFPKLIADHRATIFAAAPGIYRQMLRSDVIPQMPSLRHGLTAGEKLPDTVQKTWTSKTGLLMHEALGMSECSTFISGSPTRPATGGCLGYVQDGRHIAVLDANGAPVDDAEIGTLAIHRDDPGLMLGYLNDEGLPVLCLKNQWFATGDSVSLTVNGAVHYVGRDDDVLTAGGFRVSPIEVEAALNAHPSITESAVVDAQIATDTRVIAAFYVATSPISDAELQLFLEPVLAPYKRPRIFTQTDALPKSGNGKLNRRALRDGFKETR